MDIGIFRNGTLVKVVEGDPTIRNERLRFEEMAGRAYGVMHELAGPDGFAAGFEVLRRCPNHPERSIVDCANCDPEEAS